MTSITPSYPPLPLSPEKAITLALTLAQAERAIHQFTSDQADAIMDTDGRTYLLRPAQERLRQNEMRLQAIMDSAADVITVADRGGVILSTSGAVSRVLGYGPEELVGRSIFELVCGADMDRLSASFFSVIEGMQESATAQFYHPTKDGSYRMMEATVGKMSEGSPASAVFILRPVASPRPPPAEAPPRATVPEDASHAIDRFLGMLSHELRTPLAPIQLGVQDLQEDDRFIEARPVLSMIRRNIEVQSRLINELGDFTTLSQHKVRLQPGPIDAHEAIGFVLEICRGEIAAARIEVSLELNATDSVVVADSVRLQQVMWNLLKNAVKFSTPGSGISIATSNATTGWMTIEFTDHGIGIEKEFLPLIFDPFQQGDLSGPQRNNGFGLGLYIAKGLTEAQGGTLTVLSKGRDQGAVFRLTLPITPRTSTASH